MFLDILISTLLTFLIGLFSGDLSLSLILFGIFAGLVVDLDFIIWLIKNDGKINEYSHEHRDYLHIPLFVTLGGTIVWLVLLGEVFALVWFLVSFLHFIHDTFEGGWGIRWLYPFHGGYWTFVKDSPKKYFSNKEEQRLYVKKKGNPEWMKNEYKKKWRYMIFLLISLSLLFWIWAEFGI